MAQVGFLACGPDGAALLMLGGIAAGALALTVSFLTGFVCLFTSKRKLGFWLTSIPAMIAGLVYLWAQQQTYFS